ncbi:MAG: hypothetical protein ACLFR7_02085 [Opitutales bacterium]
MSLGQDILLDAPRALRGPRKTTPASPASSRPAATSPVRLSRRLRSHLDLLVRAFERQTGDRVGHEFCICADRRDHIVLQSGTRHCPLARLSSSYQVASLLLSQIRPETSVFAAESPRAGFRALAVNHTGITFTQGNQ